jgi:hypothetical protein
MYMQGHLTHMGCRIAAFPQLLRKIKLNNPTKASVRRHVHSLKEYE